MSPISRNSARFLLAFSAALSLVAASAVLAQPAPRAPARTPAPAAAQKAAIDPTDAWVRATPGGAQNAAVYLHIVNAGKDDDTLNGAQTDNARHASIHTTAMAGGMAQMRSAAALPIPRASTVTLAPGGTHIMLEGLKAPLREGESFIMTLTFAKAGKISTTVKVVGVAAMGPGRSAAAAKPPAPPATNPAPRPH